MWPERIAMKAVLSLVSACLLKWAISIPATKRWRSKLLKLSNWFGKSTALLLFDISLLQLKTILRAIFPIHFSYIKTISSENFASGADIIAEYSIFYFPSLILRHIITHSSNLLQNRSLSECIFILLMFRSFYCTVSLNMD